MAPAKQRKLSISKSSPGSSTHKAQRAKADGPDAITLLKSDHREIETLFAQFERAKASGRKIAIVKKICDALTVHVTIEEEIFYPRAREALKRSGQDMLDEAEVEHEGVKWRIEELRKSSPQHPRYDATVKVLSEYVKHHVKEEERELFPKVRGSDLDIAAVGAQLASRKEALTGKTVKQAPSMFERGLRALAGARSLP